MFERLHPPNFKTKLIAFNFNNEDFSLSIILRKDPKFHATREIELIKTNVKEIKAKYIFVN